MSRSDSDEQLMADSLARKRRVRGGHRGSVTRLLNNLRSALHMADVPKLKQMMGTLREKMDILAKLDGEILELVNSEDLEEEIEQADVIREDISFAVISIEETLSGKATPTHKPRRTTRRHEEDSPSTSSESSVEGEGNLGMLRDSTETSDEQPLTTGLPCTTGVSTLTFTSGTLTSSVITPSSFLPGTLFGPGTSHPSVTASGTTSSGPTIPSTSAGGLSSTAPAHSTLSAGASLFTPGGTLGIPTLSSSNPIAPLSMASLSLGIPLSHPTVSTVPSVHPPAPFSVYPTTTTPHVKLPKLTIRKFNGDLTKWVTFWDTFNSSIHFFFFFFL